MKALKMVIPSLLIGMLMAGCSKPGEQPSPASAKPVAAGTPTSVAPQQASGDLNISPSTLKSGQKATVRFTLKDSSGKPITNASVKVILSMPMGNSQMKEQAELKWDGNAYLGTVEPSMAGTWDISVVAFREGKLLLSMPSQIEVK
jgi:hypothetical protein